MMLLLATLLTITLAVVLFDLVLTLKWSHNFKSYPISEKTTHPFVSILVAIRNEEHNLERSLNSLLSLDYPRDQYEIIVGDDQSEDSSLEILRDYESRYSLIKVFPITTNLGNAKGKANVLAHLTKKARGKYYLITDADIALPVSWIQSMIAGLTDKAGMVIGFTRIQDNVWQDIDWLFALGMVKVFTDSDVPVTGMGNNMLVTKEAYESVGGYETIPFSVTEDYELFKQISGKGFKIVHIASADVLASSKSIQGFCNLLVQRKRWMKGAIQLPWPIKILLLLNALYFPAIITTVIFHPIIGLLIACTKLTFQSVFIHRVTSKLKIELSAMHLILFEFYSLVLTVSTTLYFLIPTGVKWKGRKY